MRAILRCLQLLSMTLVSITFHSGVGGGAQGGESSPGAADGAVWIYRDAPSQGGPDARTLAERQFAPFGYMPAERTGQIRVNPSHPIDASDPSKGTCIEYCFQFRDAGDWMGCYHLLQDGTAWSWGTRPGINVQELLGLQADDKVVLRFRAAGQGKATFKVGGVKSGTHPSSLPHAYEVSGSPTALTEDFREYQVGPFPADELTNLIDPFCVVTTGANNAGRDEVRVLVDDIRLVAAHEASTRNAGLPDRWRERLFGTLWLCYTPTGFDPTSNPIRPANVEEVRADLKALGHLAEQAGIHGGLGIITYGCKDGLEKVPAVAKEQNLSVILGVFNPRDQAEVSNAEALLSESALESTIAAVCVGNEAMTFRRATLAETKQVINRLRQVRQVPMTLTEIVQSYGNSELFEAVDFSFPNVHALFANITEPVAAARWAVQRTKDLRQVAPAGHLIVVKEVGWPSAPKPFSAAAQGKYWRTILSDPIFRRDPDVNLAIFEASFSSVAWKHEMIEISAGQKVDVGPHWALLGPAPERAPKPAMKEVFSWWKQRIGPSPPQSTHD